MSASLTKISQSSKHINLQCSKICTCISLLSRKLMQMVQDYGMPKMTPLYHTRIAWSSFKWKICNCQKSHRKLNIMSKKLMSLDWQIQCLLRWDKVSFLMQMDYNVLGIQETMLWIYQAREIYCKVLIEP